MKSTLGDMMKYAVMYLNEGVAGNGNRIVDRYSVQEMEKPRQFMKPGIYYGYGLETKQVGDRAVMSTVEAFRAYPPTSLSVRRKRLVL